MYLNLFPHGPAMSAADSLISVAGSRPALDITMSLGPVGKALTSTEMLNQLHQYLVCTTTYHQESPL